MKIIKLEQPNCSPCKMVSQFLDNKNVNYEIVDVTVNPEVAAKFSVMGVPVTILLGDDDDEVKRVVGFNPGQLQEMIDQL